MANEAKQNPHTKVQAAHSTGQMEASLGTRVEILLWRKQGRDSSKIRRRHGGVHKDGQTEQVVLSLSHTKEGTAITGHPATIVKPEDRALKVQ